MLVLKWKPRKGGSLAEFKLFSTQEFQKKLNNLARQDQLFLEKKLKQYIYPQIKKAPFFGINIKKLKDYNPHTWRYRIGKFRLFYSIDKNENIIYLLSIDFRRDSYK